MQKCSTSTGNRLVGIHFENIYIFLKYLTMHGCSEENIELEIFIKSRLDGVQDHRHMETLKIELATIMDWYAKRPCK